MSTTGKEHNDIRALAADEQRLAVTESVLRDLLVAALDVMEHGDRADWGGARQKRDHWDAVHESVRTDHDRASDAYIEAEFGRDEMERIRAVRDGYRTVSRGIERSR